MDTITPMQRLLRILDGGLGYLLWFVEGLLLLRLLGKAMDVSTSNGLVELLYKVTGPLVYPFREILAPILVKGWMIDATTLIAMVAGFVVMMIIRKLLRLFIRERNLSDF